MHILCATFLVTHPPSPVSHPEGPVTCLCYTWSGISWKLIDPKPTEQPIILSGHSLWTHLSLIWTYCITSSKLYFNYIPLCFSAVCYTLELQWETRESHRGIHQMPLSYHQYLVTCLSPYRPWLFKVLTPWHDTTANT